MGYSDLFQYQQRAEPPPAALVTAEPSTGQWIPLPNQPLLRLPFRPDPPQADATQMAALGLPSVWDASIVCWAQPASTPVRQAWTPFRPNPPQSNPTQAAFDSGSPWDITYGICREQDPPPCWVWTPYRPPSLFRMPEEPVLDDVEQGWQFTVTQPLPKPPRVRPGRSVGPEEPVLDDLEQGWNQPTNQLPSRPLRTAESAYSLIVLLELNAELVRWLQVMQQPFFPGRPAREENRTETATAGYSLPDEAGLRAWDVSAQVPQFPSTWRIQRTDAQSEYTWTVAADVLRPWDVPAQVPRPGQWPVQSGLQTQPPELPNPDPMAWFVAAPQPVFFRDPVMTPAILGERNQGVGIPSWAAAVTIVTPGPYYVVQAAIYCAGAEQGDVVTE